MIGGDPHIIPPYQQTTMPTNIPNEQKHIHTEKYEKQQELKPTISFEYYQQPPQKRPIAGNFDQQYFNAMYRYYPFNAPNITYPYGTSWLPPGQPMPPTMVPPVIVKNYTIETDGVTGEHKRLSMIYEDVLPQRKFSPGYTTLGERINDYQFIRASILNNTDGNDIDLHGMSTNSLNSYIKVDVGDVNPYNTYKHSPNPYKGLPYGFLLFRSCYPIRHLEKTAMVGCAKDATSINIRLYRMIEGSFLVNKYNKNLFFEFDEWREVAFYEFIRENIIKKKICPNFITMYGYFISVTSLVDYDQLAGTSSDKKNHTLYTMKNVTQPRPIPNKSFIDPNVPSLEMNDDNSLYVPPIEKTEIQRKEEIMHEKTIAQDNLREYEKMRSIARKNWENMLIRQRQCQHGISYISGDGKTAGTLSLDPNHGMSFKTYPTEYAKNLEYGDIALLQKRDISLNKFNEMLTNNQLITTMDGQKRIVMTDPNAYLGKSLVILTESPTYSILAWCTKIYQSRGNVYEMINRGFHREDEWKNILFQIMVALYVMQINHICIENFQPEKNIFIKDLDLKGTQREYWKYKIDGVDYYLPNLGFLVMIDSNYSDLDVLKDTTFTQVNKLHKLNGKFYGNRGTTLSDSEIHEKAFDMFKATFDNNVWSSIAFKKYGGVVPPSLITDLIGKIGSDFQTEKNIGVYIFKYMKNFLHNRIGTFLNGTEKQNVIKSPPIELKKGDIVIHEVQHDLYKFVMYKEPDQKGNVLIITKSNPDKPEYDEIAINQIALFKYTPMEKIVQNYKPNEENLSEDGLLETYTIYAN